MKITIIITIFFIISITFIYLAGTYLIQARPSTVGLIPKDLKNTVEVSFDSKSGNKLFGWFVKANNEKGAMLLLHGVKSNRLQMLNRARFLQKSGYSVLLFDFSAHGQSKGDKITFGYLESLDAQSAYEFLEKRVNNVNIGIIGISLGGASALLSNISQKAKVIILESVYPTITEAIENRLEIYIGSFAKIFSPLLTLQLKARLGISADELKPIDYIAEVEGAVMVIAGSLDKHTTLNQSKHIYSKAKEPKELWIIDGCGHVNFDEIQPKEYQDKILYFLEKWM